MRSVVVVGTFCCLCAIADAADRLPVGPGNFTSVLPSGSSSPSVHIDRFVIDRRPVTNAEFLGFVTAHRQWRRDQKPALFADDDYLSQWARADSLGQSAQPSQPVTRVSWFAARAYCDAQGARLPSWYEWEMAAAADERRPDARADAQWQARILNWYAQPASRPLSRVGSTPANYYGIQDLHGLIWEWVEDFSALIVSGDSRDQGDPDKLKYCGAGALSLKDRESYAVLMRVALLSSLEARSTTHTLGFRCAAEASR
jgi:formylglycine-generating enzyme